jgi:hypothetical protein
MVYMRVDCNSLAVWGLLMGRDVAYWRFNRSYKHCPCRKGCRVSVSQSGVRELFLRGPRFVLKYPVSWINSTQQSIKVFFLKLFCICFCCHYWQEKNIVLQSALHRHTKWKTFCKLFLSGIMSALNTDRELWLRVLWLTTFWDGVRGISETWKWTWVTKMADKYCSRLHCTHTADYCISCCWIINNRSCVARRVTDTSCYFDFLITHVIMRKAWRWLFYSRNM